MGRTKPIVTNEYVVGLTDGEGCFYVSVSKLSTYRTGYRVQLHFHLKMQERDRKLLEKVRDRLQCGGVYFQKEKRANHVQCYRYTVASNEDIFNRIIPFFQQYPLQTVSKRTSFEAFCKIAVLVKTGKHLKSNGLKRIVALKAQMNQKTIGLA